MKNTQMRSILIGFVLFFNMTGLSVSLFDKHDGVGVVINGVSAIAMMILLILVDGR